MNADEPTGQAGLTIRLRAEGLERWKGLEPMQVHHINCGTFRPIGGRLMDGTNRGLRGRLVCRCLLLETGDGLTLVDTGLGLRDMQAPFSRLSSPRHG